MKLRYLLIGTLGLFVVFYVGVYMFLSHSVLAAEVSIIHSVEVTAIIVAAFLDFLPIAVTTVVVMVMIGKKLAAWKVRGELAKIKVDKKRYVKDLPYDYGVGVLSMLLDFNVEFKKDVVAGVMDLVAKKYLRLANLSGDYRLRPREGADFSRMNYNERYLYACITGRDVRGEFGIEAPVKIRYRVWRDCCERDARELGLIEGRGRRGLIDAGVFRNMLIGMGVVVIFAVVMWRWPVILEAGGRDWKYGMAMIVVTLFLGLVFFGVGYFALSIVVIVTIPIILGFGLTVARMPRRTELGDEEVRDWLAFYKYLGQFNAFDDDNLEQVVIWGLYLSHAQVFGLADRVLKTGFREICESSQGIVDADYADFSKYLSGRIKGF
jgi:hypothetical protein